MKEYFEKQLLLNEPITKEQVKKLEGRRLYGEYKEGDVLLYFLDQDEVDSGHIKLQFKTFAYHDLLQLEKDYKVVAIKERWPVLTRRI